MRRVASSVLVVLAGTLLVPSALGTSSALGSPRSEAGQSAKPLPAHSQRPVCGAPAAKAARCHAHVVTHQDSAAPLATTSWTSGWSPAELASAYNLPTLAGTPGSGPTVAIVDAYDNPNAEADLNAYRAAFGLGACHAGCFTKVNQSGTASPLPAGDTGWGAEIDLDIEMVAAACPTCKILLVEATTNSFANLMAAVDRAYLMGAKFISNSYGAPEFSGETTYDGHFNHNGVAITVSSGDNGYGVEYPAASRYVTAVGGTSLTQNASLTRGWSESAWSGAGSGCSAIEQKPAWQSDAGCARRTVADVSAVANPNTGVAVYDSYGSSGGANWFVYGGTSVAAPLVAGVWALAGVPAAGSLAAGTPYAHAGWFDVLTGNNYSRCGGNYLCSSRAGYDGPTGLGTPNGASGFGGAVGSGGGGGTNTAPVASFTWSCPTLTCTFTDTSTDSENNITSRSWNYGDGVTGTATSHTYSGAGPWTVTLTVTDAGSLSDTDTQSVTATAPSGGFTLTANGFKVKGVNTVDLSWSGATGPFTVKRGGATRASGLAGTTYRDSTGTKGAASFSYQVCNSSTCSNTVQVVF